MKETLINKYRDSEKDFISKTKLLQDKIDQLEVDLNESKLHELNIVEKKLVKFDKDASLKNNNNKTNKTNKLLNNKIDLIFKEPRKYENLIYELNKMKENYINLKSKIKEETEKYIREQRIKNREIN